MGSDDAGMDCAIAAAARKLSLHTPVAYRGPYEYSLPGRERDFTMQNEPIEPAERTRRKTPEELVPA